MPAQKGKSSQGSDAYVALLRGINVGGKNMLPMKDLAAMFDKAGCSACRPTSRAAMSSFEPSRRLRRASRIAVAKAITARTKLRIPIVMRSAARPSRASPRATLSSSAASIPTSSTSFFWRQHPPKPRWRPSIRNVRRADEFIVRGAEIYLHCPNGYGRSKLSNAYFDSQARTMSTVRNWRTVLKLLELSGQSTFASGR